MLQFLLGFFVTIIFAPLAIKMLKKLKAGQNILGYVTEHSSKQGTPTMGGIIFILPIIVLSLIFCNKGSLYYIFFCLFIFFGYGLVGFLDDFIKIKFKRNLGLRPYQKIIFQILLSLFVAIFVYKSDVLPNFVYLPFVGNSRLELGVFIIPLIVLVFLATTNSVNLTDGLDGLAGTVSLAFLAIISVIQSIYLQKVGGGFSAEYVELIKSLNTVCFVSCGALLGYLCFNIYPAQVFMGDTGSLALGSLIAVVCCFNSLQLFIPIVGLMFVVSSLTVIIQVLHFKRTKKRVFLMAPFHHHLQHKGMHENKIVFIYLVITTIMGAISILFVI